MRLGIACDWRLEFFECGRRVAALVDDGPMGFPSWRRVL